MVFGCFVAGTKQLDFVIVCMNIIPGLLNLQTN